MKKVRIFFLCVAFCTLGAGKFRTLLEPSVKMALIPFPDGTISSGTVFPIEYKGVNYPHLKAGACEVTRKGN